MKPEQIAKLKHDIAGLKVSLSTCEDTIRVASEEPMTWMMTATVLQSEMDRLRAHVEEALAPVIPEYGVKLTVVRNG